MQYDAEEPFNWFEGQGPSVGDMFAGYGGIIDTKGYPWVWIREPIEIYIHSVENSTSGITIPLDTEILLGQYGYISGKVTQLADGSGIEGAIIEVFKDNKLRYITTSGSDGNYTLLVALNTYSIKVSSLGYLSKEFTNITVPHQSATTLNITLSPPLSISGTVFYSGLTENGTFYVWLSTISQYGTPAYDVDGNLLLISTFVAGNTLGYNYLFENLLLETSYWVMAFRDVNLPYVNLQQQQQNPFQADPVGAYINNPIFLTSNKTNIDIAIQDPPPAGKIVGTINYGGLKRKEVIVVLFDNPDMQDEPDYFISLGTPTSFPVEYQISGLNLNTTYYLLATMISGWGPNGPIISQEDPWYIHGDTTTFPPQWWYEIPVLSTQPMIVNFTLIDGDNPFVPKQFEYYAGSYYIVWRGDEVEQHYYGVEVNLRDNFRSAIKVEVKGPGLGSGQEFVALSSTTQDNIWVWSTWNSTHTQINWSVPPSTLPVLPLNYIIKVTTSTEGEGLYFEVSVDTFLPVVELLTPEPFTDISSLSQIKWTSAGNNVRYQVSLIDRGTDYKQMDTNLANKYYIYTNYIHRTYFTAWTLL